MVGEADILTREIFHLILQFVKCEGILSQYGPEDLLTSWKRTLASLGVHIVEVRVSVSPRSFFLHPAEYTDRIMNKNRLLINVLLTPSRIFEVACRWYNWPHAAWS